MSESHEPRSDDTCNVATQTDRVGTETVASRCAHWHRYCACRRATSRAATTPATSPRRRIGWVQGLWRAAALTGTDTAHVGEPRAAQRRHLQRRHADG
ncbi:Uncharacterized protein OBRU01_16806 [Operophtera brumata]|uniref:Uncharacterized protein n=1 Tax=Operophtera brumata TaxID=104452 RepID=A0A0L7L271_OPEBR|nr:Uncharacterized protein OBRU01_16806 [Operophtera brumata]